MAAPSSSPSDGLTFEPAHQATEGENGVVARNTRIHCGNYERRAAIRLLIKLRVAALSKVELKRSPFEINHLLITWFVKVA